MSKKVDAAANDKERSEDRVLGEAEALRQARTREDIAFVEALAKVLSENNLAEVEVTREYGDDDELTIRLTKTFAQAVAAAAPATYAALPAPAPAAVEPVGALAAAEPAAPADPSEHPGCVTSPMVGTVYLSPEPGAPNFIQTGEAVAAGQTLLIVEAMKTMNQIPAPKAGVVRQILVSNEQPVEYGAPLVIVE